MSVSPRALVRAALVSAAISACGFRAGALDRSGAVGATAVGAAILGCVGKSGAVMLGSFFVSGSLLSRIAKPAETTEKGGERDGRQVFANGGVAALAALSAPISGQARAFAMLSGALAAAASDTWATEWGLTSRQRPRMVISGRAVPRGLSGGVTVRGTLGALAGAAVSGGIAASVRPGNSPGRIQTATSIALAGVAGSVLDSLLGELLQEKRWSPAYRTLTETVAYQGDPTLHAGGLSWIDNDVVNVACTLTGALVAVLAVRTGAATS